MDVSNEPRAKRAKVDRKGRSAAFEKLKQLKESKSKYKYEVSDLDNVYEEVDEREYSKKVLARQDDDWIVDDDGCGYVEDGREIFDDDLDEDSIISAGRNKKKEGTSNKRGRVSAKVSQEPSLPGSSNIKSMLMKMPAKKKIKDVVKLDEDEVLGEFMDELLSDPQCQKKQAAGSRRPAPLSPRSYLRSLSNQSGNCIQPKAIHFQSVKRPSNDSHKSKEYEIDSFDSQSQSQDCDNGSQTIDEYDSDDSVPQPEMNGATSIIQDNPMDELELMDIPDDDVLQQLHSDQVKSANALPLTTDRVAVKETSINSQQFSDWQSCTNGSNETFSAPYVEVEVGKLPLIKNEIGEEVLRMYWLDAFEEPAKHPGVVWLFGKLWVESAKTHVSCCVAVTNIDRVMFVLPREYKYDFAEDKSSSEEVNFMDIYTEFNEKICPKYKITTFKCKRTEKNYAFNIPDIPVTSEYMETRYSALLPRLPHDLKGETFSHVFGTRTNALEVFLLERKIKGPCWLDISSPLEVSNKSSWCKIEVSCGKPSFVNISKVSLPPPPLVMVALSIRTVTNPQKHTPEIVAISCLQHNEFHIDKAPPQPPFQHHFCAITRPSDIPWTYDMQKDPDLSKESGTKTEKCDSQRALLNFFLVRLQKMDPDLIVGHDLVHYYWDMLVAKCTELNVPNMSRLGRLKRSYGTSDYEKKKRLKEAHTGRLICDVKLSAKELIKSRSYDLETLCKDVLQLNENECEELTNEDVRKLYATCGGLVRVISATMQEALHALRLMCEMNVMPLALQITTIAGNLLARTLMGGRAERNEFLLLHAFTEKGFIVPDKMYDDKKSAQNEAGDEAANNPSRNKKPAFEGGLVLDPKKGFYDKFVLLMDFNSLYPSIIQEYNICFTTIKCNGAGEAILPDSGLSPGVLPTEIRKLVESRREVKKLMKNPDLSPDLRLQYNIRQMALKLTANSMYGCLGFKFSRFFAQDLAALVTMKGREILINTKELVEKMNHDVIYGDTDSIMINTKCTEYDQVFKIGHKIKTEVNRLYRQVELEVDGVFQYLLLLKKKKYAAVTITMLANGAFTTTKEFKGLDIVRRDWSQLAAQAGRFILDQILSNLSGDDRVERIHAHLATLRSDLEAGAVPLDLLVITKQLTRAVTDYTDSKSLPHVQVAVRMNKASANKIRQGDTVPYIICLDGSNNGATQRAYHVAEVKANPDLKVDVQYYLAHQIHPVISRLCDPIEGTDAARIAECLGLDPSKYAQAKAQIRSDEEIALGEQARLSAEEKYQCCEKFTFKCMSEKCGEIISVDAAYNSKDQCYALEKCVNPNCTVAPVEYVASIQNCLTQTMRSYIHKYYAKWVVCDDPTCANRTRRIPLGFKHSNPTCTRCHNFLMFKEYSGKDLYTQICYFQHIFDLSKILEKNISRPSKVLESAYLQLMEHVERTVRQSAYSSINLTKLFLDVQSTMSISKPLMR